MSAPAPTRAQARRAAAAALVAAGLDADEAAADARALLLHAAGLDAAALAGDPDARLSPGQARAYAELTRRRAAREPLTQILGQAGFWTLELEVTRDVLSPRPDTETVVEALLAHVGARRGEALDVLDLATGSGAILIALLSELKAASGLGADISAAALAVAARNARRAGVERRARFVQASWADAIAGRFDLLACNPPYIAAAVLDGLAPEVRDHEPRLALDGGADGLDPYRALLPETARLLNPGGAAAFEIGYDQGPAVLALARAAGFEDPKLIRDLAGRDRVLFVRAGV